MEITSYILKEFKAFTLETRFEEVKSFFNETTFSHFPVVENNKLIGAISEADVLAINDDKLVGDYTYLINLFFAEAAFNLLETLKVFSNNDANLIPVVNEKNEYVGYYDLIDVLHLLNNTPFLKNDGAVLVLTKETKDYSFSEICQIIETNNGKILGLYIENNNVSTAQIIVKFVAQDINEIIQSLRRYNYNVLTKHKEDYYLEDLKERSDYLQKYLNI